MRFHGIMLALLVAATLAADVPAVLAQPRLTQGWRDLSPKQRYKSMQNYWQHQQLPQERQREIEQRYERWRSMSPDERARVQQNYERFRKLPPQERERFQRKYQKWRQEGAPHP